ncbi:beta-glucosidase 12-like [Punica granatum]|uniref:Beta-glucosidase 12-like n=1 Tax=Punica granatum TaxID=22663 RepID=A0A6P8CTT2_PUNGR|nr:beta-glucosidase 12-like [Punica granatum]
MKGDYPHVMHSLVGSRLPKFSKEQSAMLKGSFDFVGYYTANYARYAPRSDGHHASYLTDARANLSVDRNGVRIGPKRHFIVPQFFIITSRHPTISPYAKKLGIDEYDNSTLPLEQQLADNKGIEYFYRHLSYLRRAIVDGVNVKGYFAWSLLDNFEWNSGYTIRFGINYVDYQNRPKKHPKHSAIWFKAFLRNQ